MRSTGIHLQVAHVTTVHSALDSRIFYREARTAQKAGLRVAVIGPHDTGGVVEGVQIVPLRKHENRLARRLLGPLSALRAVRTLRPEIVHFHDPELIPVAVLLKAMGHRVIWDVHEYYSQVQTAHMRPGPRRAATRALISMLVEIGPSFAFDRLVFPTNSLKEELRMSSRSVACVNLLPVSEFPDREDGRSKDYDLIFVGTMSPFRAGPFMEIVALLQERQVGLRVALLGVPEGTRRWMQANAPSPEAYGAIAFLPRVPHSSVAGVIRRARIGFNYHPMEKRFQVALPMKVYEYMACGIPVVCSRFPELAQQLGEDEIVLVEGDDPKDYADAIDRLLSDPERLARVGRLGNDAVRTRLNWETLEAPKLLALYNELLS